MAGEVIRRHTLGKTGARVPAFIGIATTRDIVGARGDYVRVLGEGEEGSDLEGYGAVLAALEPAVLLRDRTVGDWAPMIHSAEHVEHIRDGDVLRLDFRRGYVRSVYRIDSPHNVIFATDRCNSNCLMCSQPPKDVDEGGIVTEHLRLIELIPPTTRALGITGGEPTLLDEGLFQVLAACRERLPVTRLHMLTNGRRFWYRTFAADLAAVGHPDLTLGIPLYADNPTVHDYVVQAEGAFGQTMVGLHNLARYGQRVEIRIVIHRQTYERLPKLAEFIYRNCPFAGHVALMGLEPMGYTKTNLKELWIDPIEYQPQLEAAVDSLVWAGMNVSIYNHQLCVIPKRLWPYARKSISDFKNVYLDECQQCLVVDKCGGLFKSGERIHSSHIAAIR